MKKQITILTLSFLLMNCCVNAQFIQQGPKLTGNGSVGKSEQGWSVSISGDGNSAIVGGPNDNGNIGAAWIYKRVAGIWTQQGPKLVGTGAVGPAGQGRSVGISSDGHTAIVGGDDDNTFIGAAWIYVDSGGIWTQQGPKLVGTGYVGNVYQGFSVSISADGNTAIVGGYSDNNFMGAAWVFTRSAGVWTQQGNKLVGTGSIGTFVWQGYSVSLSADGNTAIIGGEYDNNLKGASWVFTRTGGVWSQQGSKLVGTGAVDLPYAANQGCSVFISSDGNTTIVGGFQDNNDTGAVWIFTRTGNIWSQQGSKLVGTGGYGQYGSFQGSSVSISYSGDTAIVGGDYDSSGYGAAWIYIRSGGILTQQGSKLVGSGAVGFAGQGYSVGLSSDGYTAIIGGNLDNDTIGSAWIFYNESAGIEQVNNVQERIVVFPNPTISIINIQQSSPSPNQQITITNILGEEIYHQTNSSSQSSIDVSGWSRGVYILQIRNEKETVAKKIIIE